VNRKLAGLPVWAWVAIAAAGIAVGYLIIRRRHPASEQTPPATSGSGTNLSADDMAALSSGLSASGNGNAAPADSLSAGTLQALTDEFGSLNESLLTQGQALQQLAASVDALSQLNTSSAANGSWLQLSRGSGPRASGFTLFPAVHAGRRRIPHITMRTPQSVPAPTHGPTAQPKRQPQ
jgi:hypothetical protein